MLCMAVGRKSRGSKMQIAWKLEADRVEVRRKSRESKTQIVWKEDANREEVSFITMKTNAT